MALFSPSRLVALFSSVGRGSEQNRYCGSTKAKGIAPFCRSKEPLNFFFCLQSTFENFEYTCLDGKHETYVLDFFFNIAPYLLFSCDQCQDIRTQLLVAEKIDGDNCLPVFSFHHKTCSGRKAKKTSKQQRKKRKWEVLIILGPPSRSFALR